MKANELMIGDIIRFKHINDNGITDPHEITCIDVFNNEIHADGEIYDLRFWNIEPILLTQEIFEKNGFDTSDPEVKQYHFTEDGQRYHFSLRQMYNQKDNKPNGYSFFAFGVLTIIDYVHQLQHAFRLCGIEKEIEL